MIPHRAIPVMLLALTAVSVRGEDLLDRVDQALTFSGCNDQVRARISGLFDEEFYYFSGDAPGLIFTDDHTLWNSRLTLLLDVQAGSNLYFFAKVRADQGFDPSDKSVELRLDEYAVRWTPWDDGRFNLQVGRFSTIVGNYVERHQSWENPFISAPLIYENLTGIYDTEAPVDGLAFVKGGLDSKYEYNPVIWGASYASGMAISGKLGSLDYAAEIKNAGLSSRPESWDVRARGFGDPTVSTRIAWHPDMAWTLGFSASEGAYLTDQAQSSLPFGTHLGDFKQKVLGQDISFAWSHWQLWAEVYEARFEVPNVGNADTLGYYLEAKYKFTPNLFGALRWNQQFYDEVTTGKGTEQPWGHDLWRMDTALTYRFTPQMQLKLQYSLQHEAEVKDSISHLVATQLTIRF
jgi:hypothetical protein